MFGPTCNCSQSNLSLKSLRRVQTLFWLWVSQYNFVWGGNSIKPSWEMKFLFHNLSWSEHWPHGPLYDLTLPLPQAMVKALWDAILNLCKHLTVSLGMKPQFCTVFNTFCGPNTPQFCSSFPCGLPEVIFSQEGTSLSVPFSLKVNSIGTTLWKHLKLNLLQDSHHQPPQVAHICSWEIVSLLFLCRPALENQLVEWKPFACPYTWEWLTALSCCSWVRVNLRWCRETSNR